MISVIIPTFNRAHLITEALDSVLAQTYTDWECIIVDDGSNDNTEEVVAKYVLQDARFQFFKRPDSRKAGGNASRNFGFEKSKGEFINWFDSDDIMLPRFLEAKFELLHNNSLDAVVGFGAYFTDDTAQLDIAKPKMNSDYFLLDYVKSEIFIITCGPLWRRTFLEKQNLFDENRKKLQDVEFHFRMLVGNCRMRFYELEHLFLIRRGEDRTSIERSDEKLNDVFLYHLATFNQTRVIKSAYRKEYSQFTAKKTLRSYYDLLQLINSPARRIAKFSKLKSDLFLVVERVNDTYRTKSKYLVGLFSVTLFGKGFKYFN